MDIIIRDVDINDLEEIIDIQISSWRASYKGIIDDIILDSMDKDKMVERIKTNYQNGKFIVAINNNRVVGYCRYSLDNSYSIEYPVDCEITALYIKPELKYNGIGTKLFNYVVNEFINMNKKKMIIWCLKDNYPSIKFYQKMGGVITYSKDFIKEDHKYPEVGLIYELNKKE